MEFQLMTSDRPSVTPEQRRELLKVFSQWQPPQGVTMKSLYISADERHSFGIFEADSAAAIAEVAYTFGDYLEFQVIPIIPAQEAAALLGKTQAWVDQAKMA